MHRESSKSSASQLWRGCSLALTMACEDIGSTWAGKQQIVCRSLQQTPCCTDPLRGEGICTQR